VENKIKKRIPQVIFFALIALLGLLEGKPPLLD